MILTNKSRIKDFKNRGWWGEDTLYSLFEEALLQCENQEALIDPENRPIITGDSAKRLTFKEIDEIVERYASIFYEQGLRKDDIVIIQLPNVVELPIIYLALSKLGIICSPIPMQYGAFEITNIISEISPHAFISLKTFMDIQLQMRKIVNLSELKKLNVRHFLKTIKKDKKNKKNQIRLILTKGYGKMFIKSIRNDLLFVSFLKKYFNYVANETSIIRSDLV